MIDLSTFIDPAMVAAIPTRGRTMDQNATPQVATAETMTLVFQGSSDDTFGMTHSPRADDYDNCASGKPIEWLLTAPTGEQLIVFGQYCPGSTGGWLIGVARPDVDIDEVAMPLWPMHFERGDRAYSPALHVTVPAGTTWRCLQADDSSDSD